MMEIFGLASWLNAIGNATSTAMGRDTSKINPTPGPSKRKVKKRKQVKNSRKKNRGK
jgi:hypothetical protein